MESKVCFICSIPLRPTNRSGACAKHYDKTPMAKKRAAEWRAKNTDKIVAKNKRDRELYPDRIKQTNKRYYEENKETISSKRSQRRKYWDSSYWRVGITAEQYLEMEKAQGGKCALCGRSEAGSKGPSRLVVDHCHATGVIRGLLCTKCNLALGHFEDNVEAVVKAAEYLRKAAESGGKSCDKDRSEKA